jgi:osmoprotectant transport system permease protein
VGAGFAIAMALSVLSLRYRRAYTPITWLSGILYTIPSIALFALLIPLTGLSTLTAEIGLVSYTLLILVRNIVAGVDGVPRAVTEAAAAMGYRRTRMFVEIELPLALPVIVAGLRIATVTTVGLVTVTALIGQGGYGFLIYDGLRRFFNTPLFVGATLSVAMAVALDWLLVAAERALTPWSRRRAR